MLTTFRLRLRDYEEEDFPAVFALDTDSAVYALLGRGPSFTEEKFRLWFQANIMA